MVVFSALSKDPFATEPGSQSTCTSTHKSIFCMSLCIMFLHKYSLSGDMNLVMNGMNGTMPPIGLWGISPHFTCMKTIWEHLESNRSQHGASVTLPRGAMKQPATMRRSMGGVRCPGGKGVWPFGMWAGATPMLLWSPRERVLLTGVTKPCLKRSSRDSSYQRFSDLQNGNSHTSGGKKGLLGSH